MVAKTKDAVSPDFVDGADPTESPEGWEWDTVVEGVPARVVFDTIGDNFIGQFIGREKVELEPAADGSDPSFELFLFRGRDGDRYAVNVSYALEEGMQKVQEGQWCRLTYVKDIKTGRNLNPMKDFKVDVRK
jgi:hypothetical protein